MERTPIGIDRALDAEFNEEMPNSRQNLVTLVQDVFRNQQPQLLMDMRSAMREELTSAIAELFNQPTSSSATTFQNSPVPQAFNQLNIPVEAPTVAIPILPPTSPATPTADPTVAGEKKISMIPRSEYTKTSTQSVEAYGYAYTSPKNGVSMGSRIWQENHAYDII
jgi:hypothetical protein